MDFDPWGRESRADPYTGYARLREKSPVHRARGPMGIDAWLVTRHDDVRELLNDPRLSKAPAHAPRYMRELGVVTEQGENPIGINMLSSDPPDHTRLRKQVQRAFSRRRIENLRPRVQEIADVLVDELIGHRDDAPDLISTFAFQLPITVICELLGASVADRDKFRNWALATVAPPLTEDGPSIQRQAQEGTRAYIAKLIERKRAHLDSSLEVDDQPDLVSALVAAADQHGRLSENELIGMIQTLLVAGHETTVNLIGNTVLTLLLNPAERQRLRADPALIDSVIEESLRYEAPVEWATPRYTLEEIEIGGVRIPRGSAVFAVIASANRDPEQVSSPDRFAITRDDTGHLAFGHGIHYCLGAALARLEGQIAVGTLFRRCPDIELAVDDSQLVWRPIGPESVIRGLERLPVRL